FDTPQHCRPLGLAVLSGPGLAVAGYRLGRLGRSGVLQELLALLWVPGMVAAGSRLGWVAGLARLAAAVVAPDRSGSRPGRCSGPRQGGQLPSGPFGRPALC